MMSVTDRIVVYILVNTQVGKEDEILAKIRGMDYVTEAYIVYGEFDIIAKLELPQLEMLDAVVSKIRGIEGVTKTSTLITASR